MERDERLKAKGGKTENRVGIPNLGWEGWRRLLLYYYHDPALALGLAVDRCLLLPLLTVTNVFQTTRAKGEGLGFLVTFRPGLALWAMA